MKTILETINNAATEFMFGHVTLNEDAIKVFHIDTKEGISYFSPPRYLASLLETVEKETASTRSSISSMPSMHRCSTVFLLPVQIYVLTA